MKPFSWKCPYCRQIATITEENIDNIAKQFDDQKNGELLIEVDIIFCPNDECKEYIISASLFKIKKELAKVGGYNYNKESKPLLTWNLKPQSSAIAFPSYVPLAIRNDYEEACKIVNLSAKASATLSRRCLQGMIRDFWKVRKRWLIDEIKSLHDKLDPVTWEAIDSVRKIGNIGAHMEKDINIIVDVDPEEAVILIRLIETLIYEWYINREERMQRMKKIKDISDKKEIKKNKP